jgi:hypothetical protein
MAQPEFLQKHTRLLIPLRPLTAIVLTVLLAATGAPQSPPTADTPSEKIETGRIRLSSGAEVVYRIRLLPLSSFPALPSAVSAALQQKGCMVPQTYEARAPENVIHGAFERKGSDDWAVLCSVDGSTTLYVFFQSEFATPIALRHQRDTEWLGAEIAGLYGSAWGIARRHPSQSNHHNNVDHDVIEDAFLEKSATLHSFQNGSWMVLDAGP